MALGEQLHMTTPGVATGGAETPVVDDVDILADTRWDELVAGTDGSLFSSRRWLSVLKEVYGFEFRARVLVQDGVITGGVPYSVIDDMRGRRVVSLPFCDFNDPFVNSSSDWLQLTADLFEDGVPALFRTREHPAISADNRLTTTPVGVSHQLDATTAPDESFAGFATLPKRMIRRADSEGLVTRVTTSRESLRAFFDLHLNVRKYRHRLLAQPYELFEQIAEQYFDRGDGAIVGSWSGDQFAGGCLILVEGDTAYYKFSASHPDHRRSGVSHVTLFEGLRYAHELGLQRYDLGRSDLEPPGLVDFKRRFRPAERNLVTHTRPGHTTTAAQNPLGDLTSLFVQADVPDSITAEAGRLLYRYFA